MSVRTIFRHKRATKPAEIPGPRSLLAPVDERIAQLEAAFNYIHVTVDPHFDVEDCEWCDGQGTTSVRVYGDDEHDEHVQSPLVVEAVCQACALKPRGPIWQAGYESRSDRDIRVEVVS